MSNAALKPMSLQEFLAWKETKEQRFEFADGRIMAKAGGIQRHDMARSAFYAALLRQLAGQRCRPLLDVKLDCPNARARYPDESVDCGPLAPEAAVVGEPTVVVEVLSPRTRATDYLEKTRDYGSVPSIQVYMIVDPDSPRIDVLRRTADGLELAHQAEGREAVIALDAIGATLASADGYPATATG